MNIESISASLVDTIDTLDAVQQHFKEASEYLRSVNVKIQENVSYRLVKPSKVEQWLSIAKIRRLLRELGYTEDDEQREYLSENYNSEMITYDVISSLEDKLELKQVSSMIDRFLPVQETCNILGYYKIRKFEDAHTILFDFFMDLDREDWSLSDGQLRKKLIAFLDKR